MDPARTISEQKAEFIRAQTRILSAPIGPTEGWREYAWVPSKKRRGDEGEQGNHNEVEEERDIPDKVIADVLGRFNSQLKQHSRSVFSSQATHHVSRQIGNLYWKQIKADAEMTGLQWRMSVCELEKGADLTVERNILRLPETPWSDNDGDEVDSQTREKYAALLSRLQHLHSALASAKTKLDRNKKLQSLLEPFEKPLESIQPNLVTRDGELTREIERMRMLVTKVVLKLEKEAREGRLYDDGDRDRDVELMKMIGEGRGEREREKLKAVLGMP